MDSLSVGIRVPSINCDGKTWTRVNTDPRDDLFFPEALFLSGGGRPGSDRNGGRHQIGRVAAIRSEYLAALRWNPHLTPDDAATELSARPRCRRFTAQDKLRILAETDRAAATGRNCQIQALLQQEQRAAANPPSGGDPSADDRSS
ncbi:MAG TPA: hypothetical protein VMV33_09620 [Rhodocyclaceae bacterium]|nr:hypothetical protein [Rhodocyclaceae bacterium]